MMLMKKNSEETNWNDKKKESTTDTCKRTMVERRMRHASTAVMVVAYVALVSVLAAAAISTSISMPSAILENAYAMGDNPSTCTNLYDSVITSMNITRGHRTTTIIIDPIANPHHHHLLHFKSKVGIGYTVTLTIHSANVSNSGNTNTGSIWYGTNAYGFAGNQCINGVKRNTDITITLHNVYMGQATHGTKQSVDWYSWANDTILQGPTYNVIWY
jgi:hypothetical protein